MRFTQLAVVIVLAPSLYAQPNAVPGLDIGAYNVGSATVYGRRGPAFPNGEAGVGIGHSMCNSGTVDLPWVGWSGSIMLDTYPKIAFLLARESGGRMVQVSGKSYMKHSRVAFNFSSGPCAPCQRGSGGFFFVGCSDTYSTGFNGNRFNLGPTDEVDPWLGTWDSQGTYFDRGDPPVGGSAAMDRVQSLTSGQISQFDVVKNRVTVPESELAASGSFHGQVHLMIQGEPVANRGNNLLSRPLSFSWNGSSWSVGLTGTPASGSVLTKWTGAVNAMGGNGADDGRFLVACRVTGPVDGSWHYEYAVHNIDNTRGGASLRVPVCRDARVQNAGFRDIDQDVLNQWTFGRTSNEVAFLAAAKNALDWNTIYNFWFDSDAAPVTGNVVIDQARLGPGAPTVSVSAPVPGVLGHEYLGAGCGSPAPALFGNGVPAVPNAGYALQVRSAPGAMVFISMALAQRNTQLGNGCELFIDTQQPVSHAVRTADGAGVSSWNLPIPPGLPPFDVYSQAAEQVAGGPLFGQLALSNGLRVRVGAVGCR